MGEVHADEATKILFDSSRNPIKKLSIDELLELGEKTNHIKMANKSRSEDKEYDNDDIIAELKDKYHIDLDDIKIEVEEK